MPASGVASGCPRIFPDEGRASRTHQQVAHLSPERGFLPIRHAFPRASGERFFTLGPRCSIVVRLLLFVLLKRPSSMARRKKFQWEPMDESVVVRLAKIFGEQSASGQALEKAKYWRDQGREVAFVQTNDPAILVVCIDDPSMTPA